MFDDWYRGNLLAGIRQLQDEGVLEIITCAPRHDNLPSWPAPSGARADPRGFRRLSTGISDAALAESWLANVPTTPVMMCCFKNRASVIFMEAHGLLYAKPRPRYGVYAPAYCPSGFRFRP